MRIKALLPLLLLAGCSLFVRPDVQKPADGKRTPEDERVVGVATIDTQAIAPRVKTPYWDLIRRGGPLVVGIAERYPPFSIATRKLKRALGKPAWVGLDVELAQHLGETLGVPVVFKPVRAARVPALLNAGKIDVAIAGLTRTVLRAAQVNFSAPYLIVSQAALVERRFVSGNRGTDEERRNVANSYLDLAKIPGIRIGVARGTRPHRLAISNFPGAKLVSYADLKTSVQALLDGKVNALVGDAPYIRALPAFFPKAAGRFEALLEPVTKEPIAMAIRKGDLEFLRFLDAYVAEVRQDGTVQKLYRRHFIDGAWKDLADLGSAR